MTKPKYSKALKEAQAKYYQRNREAIQYRHDYAATKRFVGKGKPEHLANIRELIANKLDHLSKDKQNKADNNKP